MQPVWNVGPLFLAAAGLLAAADAPYMGKWKLNPAKSDFGQTTISFAKTSSGDMQFTAEGQSYTFKTDGKDTPALFGTTAAWKQVDANTWETTYKINGKVLSVDTTKLSADGKSLTVESKGTKPDGGPFDDVTVFQAVDGTSGIAGKWKTKNVKISAPGVMEFTPNGADGVTWSAIDLKATCSARFGAATDGACSGATFGPGFAWTVRKTGSNAFEGSVKHDGKTLWISTYTVSADGKALTEASTNVVTSEKTKFVYDKQ
ncbi:MAG: hypothetical protein LAP87_26465 [Acidobacteriia bacterium]|nr:hypothetical protein [Terriglobia bacterium]